MADLYRVEVTNARAVAGSFERGERRARTALVGNFRGAARQVEDAFRAEAPVASGRLRESVRAAVSFRAGSARINVAAGARNPEDGFNYLNVTRFGHRHMVIEPKEAERLAIHYAGRDEGSKIAWVPRASGYHPDHDWAGAAARRANPIFTAMSRRIGEDIERGMMG
jgi:hypothetical protein